MYVLRVWKAFACGRLYGVTDKYYPHDTEIVGGFGCRLLVSTIAPPTDAEAKAARSDFNACSGQTQTNAVYPHVLFSCVPLRKLADLEAEARAMGATVPPPPNPAFLAQLGGGGRGSGAEASGGRGGRGGGR